MVLTGVAVAVGLTVGVGVAVLTGVAVGVGVISVPSHLYLLTSLVVFQ